MNIAFLHRPNDPYTLVRIKYFLSIKQEVISIVFNEKEKQQEVSGLRVIELPNSLLLRVPFLKRLIYAKDISRITSENKIDVLYIVSALNSFYLNSSKAKINFLEIQGSDVIKAPHKFPFLKKFYRYYWKFANGLTQDSEVARNKAKEYLPEEVLNETIEIGVNFNIFNERVAKGVVRKKYNLQQRPIIFHSRGLAPNYNVEVIINSIPDVKNRFNDVCFIFAGNVDNLPDKITRFIEVNNLNDNILFPGYIDHNSEMKYFYADADFTVSVPSSDSSPFSVYESMATKTPVIVSELPWYEGKFIPDKHIYTVPDRNVKSLSAAIIKMLNKEIQLDLNEAYNIVFDKINMKKENKKLFELFKKVI